MLGKLLKHEFRATGRVMLPVLGVLALLAVMFNVSVRLIDRVNSHVLQVLFGLVIFAFVAGIIAAEIIAVVLMINRFYKNLLGEEGYLMFTLPASVHELVWSKLIASFVWFLATNLVIMLLVALTALSLSSLSLSDLMINFPSWRELWEMLAEVGLRPADFVVLGLEWLLAIIAGCLTMCLHFYAAMALGYSFSNHKGLFSVLFFIGISFAFQFLTGAVGVVGLDQVEDLLVFDTAAQTIHGVQGMFAAALGWELVQAAILYLLTTLGLKKFLNLA